MKVVGLIVEYNPFHNGHLYHMEQSKKLSGADFVVCVMSGNFIQRGEPAIVNKWARAKMALLSGADLVIELPAVYAMSTAEFFAHGAVKLLDSTGIIDCLCFGSESGNLNELYEVANILCDEPQQYKGYLKDELDKGKSFPAARESALLRYLSENLKESESFSRLLGSSNNILGIEYLKALLRIRSSITPLTVTRINNAYNSEDITGNISSATAIRKNIAGNPTALSYEDIRRNIPEVCLPVLNAEFEAGRGPVSAGHFEDILLYYLRKAPLEELRKLPYIAEGLENRLKEAAESSGSFERLIENASTKRYTKTRLQRSIFSILTGLKSAELMDFNSYGGPQYLRVLGFNRNGRELISIMNRKASLPVIVKTADFKKSCNPLLRRMLEIEAASTDMYVLAYKNPDFKKSGQEFTQNIIRI